MILNVFSIGESLHINICHHAVVRVDLQKVLNGAAFRCACAFGNLVNLKPEAAAHLGKEEHCAVHVGVVHVLDKVLVAGVAAF